MTKLTGRGGPGRGQGRKPKPPDQKYRGKHVKFPPDILEWLKVNTKNQNGFIVEAVREKIERFSPLEEDKK